MIAVLFLVFVMPFILWRWLWVTFDPWVGSFYFFAFIAVFYWQSIDPDNYEKHSTYWVDPEGYTARREAEVKVWEKRFWTREYWAEDVFGE